MPNVDQRIVQMEFDNKQFERGVEQSLKSLDALKKGLELDKAAISLSNLEKVANRFDISGIADSINKIGYHFTFLGRNIDRMIDGIASKFTAMLKSISIDQVSAGMSKYETQTKAVQTIMNATGKEIHEVEGVLQDLMKYTDETSYDFSTMAESIGKFTSVGVDLKKAEKAMEGIANEAAMSGAGKAEANRAMYNFSQALSAGYVKLIDWKSIENANMATKTFKEELIKTAIETGKLNKITDTSGEIIKGTGKSARKVTVDFKTFNETLSDQWLTSDVLITTLEKYANKTEGIGKQAYIAAQKALTFTDAMDAIKDAVSSGWMQSFKYMFGNLNEAMDLWTGFCNNIIEFTSIFSEARNEILKAWHDQEGYNAAIEIAGNLWGIFMAVVRSAKDVFEEIFFVASETPLTDFGKQLADATKHIRDVTKEWRELMGYDDKVEILEPVDTIIDKAKELDKNLKRNDKNDYVRKLQEELINLGKLDKNGADGIFGPKTEKAVKSLQKELGVKETGLWDANTRKAAIAAEMFKHVSTEMKPVIKQAGEIYYTEEEYDKTIDRAKRLKKLLRGGAFKEELKRGMKGDEVKELQQELIDLGLLLDKNGADGIYGPKTEAAVKELQKQLGVEQTGLWDVNTRRAMLSTKAFYSTQKATKKVKNVVEATTPAVDRIQRIIRGVFAAIDIGKNTLATVGKIIGHVVSLFEPVGDALLTIAAVIGDCIDQLDVFLVESGTFDAWFEAAKTALIPFGAVLKSIGNAIKGFFERNKGINTFSKLWAALNKELGKFKIWTSLKNLFNSIKKATTGVDKKFNSLYKSVSKFAGNKFQELISWLGDGFPKVIDSISLFINDISKTIRESEFLKKTWTSIKTVFEGVIGVIGEISGAIKDRLSSLFQIKPNDSSGPFSIKNFLVGIFSGAYSKIVDIVDGIKKKIKEFGDAHPVFKTISDSVERAIGKIKEFITLLKNSVLDFFTNKSGGDPSKAAYDMTNQSPLEKLKERLKAFQPVVDWFKQIADDLTLSWNKLFGKKDGLLAIGKSGNLNILDDAGGFFDKITAFYDKFKSFDFSSLIGPALAALGGYLLVSSLSAIGNMARGFANFGKASKNISKGLNKMFENSSLEDSISALTGKWKPVAKKDPIGTTFLKIAGSVAIVAASLAVLTFVDQNKLKDAATIIGIIVGSMATLIVGVSRIAKDPASVGKAFFDLAKSIALIVASLWVTTKIVDKTDPGILSTSLLIIAGMLGSLAIIEVALSRLGKGNTKVSGVLQMCAGLFIVVLAFSKMTKVIKKFNKNPDILYKAFGAIEIMLLTLGGIEIALVAANKSVSGVTKISGILAMSVGLLIIVRAFQNIANVVNKVGPDTANQAFGIIESLLLTIGGIAFLISKFGGGAARSIASAVPIIAMGFVMKLIINSFKDAIASIQGSDPELLKIFFTGVEVAMGILAGIVIAFGNMPVATFIGSAGLVAVMAALGAGIAIIAEVGSDAIEKFSTAMWIVGSKLGDFESFTKDLDLGHMGQVCSFVVDSIGPMIEAFVGMYTGVAVTKATQLSEIGAQLYLLGDSIKSLNILSGISARLLVDDAAYIVDVMSKMSLPEDGVDIERVGAKLALFDANISDINIENSSNAKTMADDAKSIADTMKTISSVDGIEETLTGLGGALKLYYNSLIDIDPSEVKTVDSDMISNAFASLSGAIPLDSISTITSFATGGENDMAQMAIGITNLGTALSSYGKDIGELDDSKIQSANAVLGSVQGLHDNLTAVTWSDILGIFVGERESLSSFSEDIVTLGSALGKYGESIGGLDASKIFLGNIVLGRVQGLKESLEKVSWDDLLGFLKGKRSSISAFGGDMVVLGGAISKYADSTSGLDAGKIEMANGVIGVISTLNEKLPTTGGLWKLITGDKKLGSFASNMSTLGDGVKGYADKVASADLSNVSESMGAIERLGDVFAKLGKTGGVASWFSGDRDLSDLSKGLPKVGEDLISFQTSANGFSYSNVEEALQAVEKIVGFQAAIDWKNTNTKGLGLIGQSVKKLFTEFASIETEVVKGSDGKTILESSAKIGELITTGIGNGIESGTNSEEDAAPKKKMILSLAAICKAGIDALSVGAPFEKIGESISKAIAVGVLSKTSDVSNSVGSVVKVSSYSGRNYRGSFEDVGKYLVKGLAVGIQRDGWQASEAFASVVRTAYYAGRRAAQVNSPSRLTMWMGEMIDMGLVVGLQNYSDKVASASSDVATTAIDSAKLGLNALSETILNDADNVPTIRPVLDLSEIQNGASGLGTMFGNQTIGVRSATIAGRIAAKDSEIELTRSDSTNVELAASIATLNDRLDQLDNSISSMQVVMDNGALVGQLGPGINRYLGKEHVRSRR